MSNPNTPTAFKRLFVGPGAEYAQTGVEEDVARIAGINGDILTINSDEEDGDSIVVRAGIRQRADGIFNVKAYGAIGDGSRNDTVAIQAAMDAASASTYGGELYFPPGLYRIVSPGIVLKANVTLTGAGRSLSVLWKDDSSGDFNGALHNVTTFPSYSSISSCHIRNLGFKGRADVVQVTTSGQLVHISCDDLTIDNCEFTYSRHMALNVARCRRAVITNCRVYRSIADGIAAWNCGDLIIANNEIYGANDDGISAHSDDNLPTPVRSGVLITGNMITESQGIAVLGAKAVTITDNTLRRIMAGAIRVRSAGTDSQGQTAQFACRVSGNVINDVFLRSEAVPRNGAHYGILISGGIRRNGGGSSPPGEPVSGTGTVASLYGTSGVGTLYLNETGSGGNAAPAGYAIDVTDNIIMRTLPACTAISDWGYGSDGLWVGDNGTDGFYTGAITDAALRPPGIQVDPAFFDCRIARNTIRTGGTRGIEFRAQETVTHGDYRGLLIEGNKIADISDSGIYMPSAATTHRVIIRHNEIDGDPLFRHTNRGSAGTWLVTGAPYGVYAQTSGGYIIEGNHFRNVAVSVQYPTDGSTFTTLLGNFQYGTVAGLNFNTGNKGCGTMIPNGVYGWTTIPEDADPTSASYGRLIGEVERARSSIPTTGYYTRGHVIWNTNPTQSAGKVKLGWLRMTTGNGHVLNTDWTEFFGTTT